MSRDEYRSVHRDLAELPQRLPGQRSRHLGHRLECHRSRQHRHPVDPVIGEVRVGPQAQPGVADELNTGVVQPDVPKEPAAGHGDSRCRHRGRRRDADPAVHRNASPS